MLPFSHLGALKSLLHLMGNITILVINAIRAVEFTSHTWKSSLFDSGVSMGVD